jgi:hypothetical protein
LPTGSHLLAESARPAVVGLSIDNVPIDLVQLNNLTHLVNGIDSTVSATGTRRIDPIHVDQESVDSVNK